MLNELVTMVNNESLDRGVRCHLARTLRRAVIVEYGNSPGQSAEQNYRY